MPSLTSALSGGNNVNITVTTTANGDGVTKTQEDLRDLSSDTDKTGQSFLNFGNVAKLAFAAVGAGVAAASVAFVKSAADLQQTSQSFQVLTGNVDVANKLFAQLATYANTTPFEFPDIAKAGQTLLGFGIQSGDVYDKIKILGDIAAATGADFGSLALVFGQVNATGKLMGQDALQLINNRIPIYNILAKKMGIATADVKAKVEAGAVSVDIFNSALEDVTKSGGFAFEGTTKLANTLNGRLSTLSDSVLNFGRNLIGVHVDPELGLVIDKGGLFDRFSEIIPVVSDMLSQLTPIVSGAITGLMDLGRAVGEFLGPKLQDLWKTISEDIIPILQDLWTNVLQPLIPLIGETLVGAIGLAIDALNVIFQTVGYVWTALQNGNPIVWLLVGAFTGLAAAMAFNAVFDALNVGFNVIRLVTIPNVIASVDLLKAAIAAPMVMPAIAVGAALAAIALVIQAAQQAQAALDALKSAKQRNIDSGNQTIAAAKAGLASGQYTAAQANKLIGIGQSEVSDANKIDDSFWGNLSGWWNDLPTWSTGGYTGPGGVTDVAGVVHKGEYVVPQSQVDQSTGQPMLGNTTSISVQQVVLANAEAVQAFVGLADRDAQMATMKLTQGRGDL